MSYYYYYINKLKSVCEQRKIELVEIGRVSRLPMYKIVLNPRAKQTVVFSAGIHGDEIAGPWAIIDFLKKFNFKKSANIKIIIFPVASPTSFDNKIRNNHLGKNLNRLFCRKTLTNENRILFQNIKNEKVFFFHALHEDVDERSFYLYNFERKSEFVYRDIVKIAKKYFPINKAESIYGDPAVMGLIINRPDGSFEDRMFREGALYSMCTETPGKQSLKQRIALNVEIMNKIVVYAK